MSSPGSAARKRPWIQLIGALRIYGPDGTDLTPKGRKTRALVGLLALDAGEPILRSRLAGAIWDRSAEAQAHNSLRQALSEINDALGPFAASLIRRESDSLRLDPTGCDADVSVFLKATPGDPLPDGEIWVHACRATLLEELDGISGAIDDWLHVRRQDFRNRVQLLCETRLRRLTEENAAADLRADAALALIEFDPASEIGARARMRALADLGRTAEARREFERISDALRRLLDAAPTQATIDVWRAISAASHGRRVDPASTATRPVAAARQIAISDMSTAATIPLEAADAEDLFPSVGVLPLVSRVPDPAYAVLGEFIADEVIGRLSTAAMLRVISRLSTSAVGRDGRGLAEIGRLLGAHFVVSGSYHASNDRVIAFVELADTRSQRILWNDKFEAAIGDILSSENRFAEGICSGVANAIASSERRRVLRLPLPTLESYSLQLAGTTMIHRPTHAEFMRAFDVLSHLVERFPRTPEPRAWLGQWHVMQVTRGHASTAEVDPRKALEQTHRAIDLSPDCSLALAIEGLVHCHLLGNLEEAERTLRSSLEVNQNESLAWLFLSVVQVFRNQGEDAWLSARRAMQLSPFDPMQHYFKGLASAAALASGRLVQAIDLAKASLSVNGTHVPTLRQLAVSQVESGQLEEARETVSRILAVHPNFNITDYLKNAPKGGEPFRLRCAPALRAAGVPET